MATKKQSRVRGSTAGTKSGKEEVSAGVAELIRDRDAEYGAAWIVGGRVIGFLGEQFIAFVRKAPEYTYTWVVILSKMLRILQSPHHLDSWKDIAGYAMLVVEEEENGKVHTS